MLFLCNLSLWPFYTVLRLVVCSVLLTYIIRSKADYCVQSSQLTNQRTAHRFGMRAPNPYKASSISDLFSSSWVLQYVFGGKNY